MRCGSVKQTAGAIAGFALSLCPLTGTANNPVTDMALGDVPEGTVGLGFGFRWGDSPYTNVDDIGSKVSEASNDILPFYYYEGRWLFSHGSKAGVHLLDAKHFELDALLSYRFTRLEEKTNRFLRPIDEREQTLEGGLRAAVKGDWGRVSLMALTDTLDRHNGYELDLTYRYDFRTGKFFFAPYVSYLYQDESLSDYYYGVSDEESRPARDLDPYQVGESEFARLGINTTYRWSKRMRLFANYSVDFLPDNVKDSPIVDKDQVHQVMLGFAYRFGNVIDDAEIRRRNPERAGEWSWRINYGYTAEETFHKVHRGYFQSSRDVDTTLAGFTVGKLMLDGPRADFWGKVSLNRRLENDLQDDFWELNAYVMAMGTGYSPWSSREVFRYGFGFGFSYAHDIPAIEQVKQARRTNGDTSHFLNYLEAQVDFPMRNFFGDRGWWQDCYAGLTIVHRSGIFGRVDILDNVDGGSDVLTAHMECRRK
ncbi:MAG: MipA/OmpV family protein [Pseudomonadota bacterium]